LWYFLIMSLEVITYPAESGLQKVTELYVELGHGLAPAAASNQRRFNGNRAYLGIDKAEGDYAHLDGKDYGQQVCGQVTKMAAHFALKKPDENIAFIRADARNLPLPDAVATEVYMANLLTSPINPNYRRQILKEVGRILMIGGKAVVKMSWEPEWLSPRHYVVDWLHDAHLEVLEVVDTSAEAFNDLEELYYPSQHQGNESYYVIATKPSS
jgi:ubiquinone/menaquinone biosynthesis C-methylase UbiE